MALQKNSPVMQSSGACGSAPVYDRLANLLPPSPEELQEAVEFWLIVIAFEEGNFE
jgi:hypothetical protein